MARTKVLSSTPKSGSECPNEMQLPKVITRRTNGWWVYIYIYVILCVYIYIYAYIYMVCNIYNVYIYIQLDG